MGKPLPKANPSYHQVYTPQDACSAYHHVYQEQAWFVISAAAVTPGYPALSQDNAERIRS
jgi:hypothetical protein